MNLFPFIRPAAVLVLGLSLTSVSSAMMSVKPGSYAGRCESVSVMQYFEEGKKAGKPFSYDAVTLIELSVEQKGKTQEHKTKNKVFGEKGPDGHEYEMKQVVEKVGRKIERRTNVDLGGSSDYLIEADGSRRWISSTDKDGVKREADGVAIEYVDSSGTLRTSSSNNYDQNYTGQKFTGWALSSTKMWCEIKPILR